MGFGSATKNVQGSGHINGDDGHLPADINYIDDRDVWDAPNFEVGTGHQVTSWLPEADGDAENPAQV